MWGGRALVVVAALLFATGGSVIKSSELSALQLVLGRSAVAALFLCALGPRWRALGSRRTWAVGCAYAVMISAFVVATKLTTAGHAIFLQSTALLWVMALGPRWLGEPAARGEPLYAGLLLLGLGCLAGGGAPVQATAPDPLLGNAVGILAGVAWAFTLLGLRWLARVQPEQGNEGAVVVGNVLAAALCLPFALPLPELDAGAVTLVLYLGLVQLGLAYVFLTRGVRRVPAVEASLLLLIEPVVSPLLTWWLHGERLGDLGLLGCALVLGASVARTLAGPRHPV